MDLHSENELDLKYLKFIKYFIISVECALVYFTVLFYVSGIRQVAVLDFFSLISVGYSYYLVTKFITDYKTLIQIGFYLFTLFLYIHVLILSDVFPIMHSLFFLLPLAVYILTDYNSAIKWAIVVFTLSLCTTWVAPFLSTMFNIHIQINITEQNRLIINYSFVVACLYFAFFMLSFLNDFNSLREAKLKSIQKQAPNNESNDVTEVLLKNSVVEEVLENNLADESYPETVKEHLLDDEYKEEQEHKQDVIPLSQADIEKYQELYEHIVRFFEEKKPYKDPEYNINKLAASLETNTTYIYRTLKHINNTNFKSFLNHYRINEIKERLNNKEHQKYTLKHIYNDSGFMYQATFNRIFKEIVGVTPSEYIDQLER
jgi:AraC-like DNA-binding protein